MMLIWEAFMLSCGSEQKVCEMKQAFLHEAIANYTIQKMRAGETWRLQELLSSHLS